MTSSAFRVYNILVKGVFVTAEGLKKGIPAVIVAISGERAFKRRLQALGATAGTPIVCLGTAPLGDPIVLAVKNTRIAVRKTDAKHISVEYDKRNWTKRVFI